MTTVAVMARPPVAGVAGTDLAAGDVLTETEAADLYGAMLGDVVAAVDASGAELLVNYVPAEQLPAGVDDPVARIRAAIEDAVDDADAVRCEPQVGSSFAARVGNTVTHLLETDGVRTAAFVTPAAALVGRQQIDSAAMKLRRHDVVLGPATEGRVYYGGFAEPIDFADGFAAPELTTLTDRAVDADSSVDFLPTIPLLRRPSDLSTVLPVLQSYRRTDRRVPERTAARIDELGLAVDWSDRSAVATED